jgi:hypothetical protein
VAHARSAGDARPIPVFSAADRLVLRLAFAATSGFALALILDWEFSFLTPMLAVQIVAGMPVRPSLGQGLAIPLVILVATTAALAASTLLLDAQLVLIAVVALVICWGFYAQRRGAPAILILLVQIAFCGVPLMSSISLDLAHSLAEWLQKSSLAAIVIVWISHALFAAPAPPIQASGPAPKPAGLGSAHAARVAISDTLVLMPLLTNFMIGGDINNFVILMITINLLREVEIANSQRMAVGLLVGNTLGGALAVGAQQIVFLADSLAQFLLSILLAALWFGGRIVRGGHRAPIFGLAFATFILLIGIAITPLPGGSEEAFVVRVLKVAAASLYTLGALSLLTPLRRVPAA